MWIMRYLRRMDSQLDRFRGWRRWSIQYFSLLLIGLAFFLGQKITGYEPGKIGAVVLDEFGQFIELIVFVIVGFSILRVVQGNIAQLFIRP